MLKLTATNLPRFIVCNGSITMPVNVPYNVNDESRIEGNAAHWLIEKVHKRIHTVEELTNRKAENGFSITGEMVEHTEAYLKDIMDKGFAECDTSYGDGQNYQINGRADWLNYDASTATLDISDFKYGWSIIEAKDNWTLISHAIGFILNNPNFVIHTVRLRVYQPRPHHPLGKIREHVYTIQEIHEKWSYLKTILFNPSKILNTSTNCKDCPARVNCPATMKAEMNAIDISETAYIANVDDITLGFLLDQIDRATETLKQGKKAYTELALHRLKAGKIVPGYGVEKDLTNKQWKDGITVDTAMLLTGKDLGKKQLITPKQAIDLGVPEATIDALSERKEKGVKLSRISAATQVKKLFKSVL